MPRIAPVLVALLAIPLALPATADEGRVVEWRYTISIPDLASGNARVELRILGADDLVARYNFSWAGKAVSNVTGGASTPIEVSETSVAFDVDGDESFSYDVSVVEQAFRGDERLNHVGSDFALFKADLVQLTLRYDFFQGEAWTNRTTVELLPPAGWEARGPWRTSGGVYALAPNEVAPRGFVVFGEIADEIVLDEAGKRFRYVRLGAPAAFEADMAALFRGATPYYESVYGPGVGGEILVINAPDPMFHGGLGGSDSIFVHEDVELQTLAHEYAHVYQLFASESDGPSTTIWLTEGDADYHSALALVAAGFWTGPDVNRFLEEARADQAKPELADAWLSEARYGGDLEKFAYHKGAVVLHALDQTMTEASGGAANISSLLKRLNADHGPGSPGKAESVTNEEIRSVASELVGFDLSEFFDRFVDGAEWPPEAAFVPEGRLVVRSVQVRSGPYAPGDLVDAAVEVENVGTAAVQTDLVVKVDGAIVATARVALAANDRHVELFSFEAGEPGGHVVRILDATAEYRVLRPARVFMTNITYPDPIRAGDEATFRIKLENRGELAGNATLEMRHGDRVLAKVGLEDLGPGASREVPLDATFDAPGVAAIVFRVESPGGSSQHAQSFNVTAPRPPPRGDDGAPSAVVSPRAPETGGDPPRSRPGAQGIPFAGVAVVAVALAAAAIARRR